MFSSRLKWNQNQNPLSALLEEKRRAGARVLDLTESNPTRAGLEYPESEILDALASRASLQYDPDPRGLLSAREAVSQYYAERGVEVNCGFYSPPAPALRVLVQTPDRPGDDARAFGPPYPLFEFLSFLESVAIRQYPLRYDGGWHIDFDALLHAATPRTRAVIVVNPNNPTGSFLKQDEAEGLEYFATRRELAILSDEVFADYGFEEDPTRAATLAGDRTALTFCMSGLSKIAGLPQLKLGWVLVSGRGHEDAIERLEWIADTYLSVATPVQAALPRLLEISKTVRAQIRKRTAANLAWLRNQTAGSSASVLRVEGGWYAILQVPRTRSEEAWALALLRESDVLVQPGFFYDFDSEAFLVLSLLTEPETFTAGVRRILAAMT